MNPKAPKILNELVEVLRNANLTAAESVGGEGRAGSLKDEQNVIGFLKEHPKFKSLVVSRSEAFPEKLKVLKRKSTKPKKEKKEKSEARKVGDLLIKDPDSGIIHVINIKTTGGSTDNATSKLGFLIALTNLPLEDLPNTIDWNKWTQLIYTHKADVTGRDYWFLVLDKADMSHIVIRGAKQINNWGINPSNDLQISWKDEWDKEPADCSFDEAFNKIVSGLQLCKAKMALTTSALIYAKNPALQKQIEAYLKELIPAKKKKSKLYNTALFTE
jgi:hypothetical protein